MGDPRELQIHLVPRVGPSQEQIQNWHEELLGYVDVDRMISHIWLGEADPVHVRVEAFGDAEPGPGEPVVDAEIAREIKYKCEYHHSVIGGVLK
jgi:hypothetical protein